MANNLKSVATVAALGVLSAGGYYLFQQYDRELSDVAEASMNWPQVPGLVVQSNLEYRRRESVNSRKTDFRIEVSYEYVVDDRVYENDVVRFDQRNLSNADKELLVSAYPVGKRVDVFYNPDHPGQAVLERGSYASEQ